MTKDDNFDIEKTVIASIIHAPKKQRLIFNKIKTKYFSNYVYKEMFKTALEIYKNGTVPDNVLIYQECTKHKKAIYEALVDITTDTLILSPMVEQYCDVLFRNYVNRSIKSATTIEEHQAIIDEQKEYNSKYCNVIHISEGSDTYIENMHKRQENGIFSGINTFDDIVGCFMGGDCIVLGARPSMGKTAFALNLAERVCIQQRHVLYFSLEMPAYQLQNRFVCQEMGLNAEKYRTCGFTTDEMLKYKKGLDSLKEYSLFISTDYDLTPDKAFEVAGKLKDNCQLDFVILDYLQLMRGDRRFGRTEDVTYTSRQMKLLATSLDVPILIVSQLSRELERRQDKRPQLSDLRDSGAIEQDADTVLFLYRDYIYSHDKSKERDLEMIISKSRHTSSEKIIRLDFDLARQKITEKTWKKFG